MTITIKDASRKYGFPETELRELVRRGIIKKIAPQKYQESDIQRYYEDFWATYINVHEMNKIYKISSTKLTKLAHDKIIRRNEEKNGLYYREDFMQFLKSEDKEKYEKQIQAYKNSQEKIKRGIE